VPHRRLPARRPANGYERTLNPVHALSARGAAGALLVLALASAARADDAAPPPAPVPLLPGAYVFDVTRPPFGATPDDDTDDTAAIQKAIDAAAAEAARAGQTHTAQQIVFLPPGVYRVSDTLAFAKNKEHRGHDRLVEALQWLYGAGMDRTVIRLRPARGGTVLGSAEAPKPVVQTAD